MRLLLRCVRNDPDAGNIQELISPGLDWTLLVHWALRHGVAPLVARALARTAPAVPPDIRGALLTYTRENERQTAHRVRVSLELRRALAAAGVPALSLDGAVLGALAYGDPSLRRAEGVDLLVREEDMVATVRVLRELGFSGWGTGRSGAPLPTRRNVRGRDRSGALFVRPPTPDRLRVHRVLGPPGWAVRLGSSTLWSTARLTPVPGGELLAPAPAELLLVTSLHGAASGWSELRWVADLAGLVERQREELDTAMLLTRARNAGVERIVLVGLRLASDLLGVEPPAAATRRLERDRTAGALSREAAGRFVRGEPGQPTGPASIRLQLLLRDRLPDRAAWLAGPAAREAVATPARHVWQRGRQARRERLPRGLRGRLSARVLVVDWVPHLVDGAGMPRMNRILNLLVCAGARVTLHPAFPCFEDAGTLYRDLPRELEVIPGRGLGEVEAFLERRAHEFDAILVARPTAMAPLADVFARRPELVAGRRLIYDSEALFAVREVQRRRLRGEAVSEAEAEGLVRGEVELGRGASAVIVTSRAEQSAFERWGGPPTHRLPYIARPAPGRRPFHRRRGLLFVGRIADDGSPNVDSLRWFQDEVLERVRSRLGNREHPLLTVVGLQGADELAVPPPGTEYRGVVPVLDPLYARALVFVAPTRFAAGAPAKVYEAAAHGLPVVATKLLADQLGWRPGVDLLASDPSDAGAFAENVVSLYTRPELWRRLRANALARVREECSPAAALETLSLLIGGDSS